MHGHNATWADCQEILISLFTHEELTCIKEAAEKIVRGKIPDRQADPEGRVQTRNSLVDPNWDPNDDGQMQQLRDYQTLLVDAMREEMKKPVNLANIRDVWQEPKESPDHFYERLLEAYQRFTPLDVKDPRNQHTINLTFVTQSAMGIRQKLQKKEGFAAISISHLLERTRKVYDIRGGRRERER